MNEINNYEREEFEKRQTDLEIIEQIYREGYFDYPNELFPFPDIFDFCQYDYLLFAKFKRELRN